MDEQRLGIVKILSLPCDVSTRIISDGMDRGLSRKERLALRLHLLICRPCRRFRAQLSLLRRIVARQFGEQIKDADIRPMPVGLSSSARGWIADAVNAALRDESESV